MTVNEIRQLVIAIDPTATHYVSTAKTGDFTTWHEYRRDPLQGDDEAAEEAWSFQVDRFTRMEEDPMTERIYTALQKNDRVTVTHLTMFERETGYIHHIYQCTAR